MIRLVLLTASLASAQTADTAPKTVAELHEDYLQTVGESAKQEILARIAQTPPVTTRDVQRLLDLFTRFPEPSTRRSVMDSLHRLKRDSPHLEPYFLGLLAQPEAEEVLFGINGALVLRATEALPKIHEIAKRPFPSRDTEDLMLISERNQWWLVYEALSALAQWDGPAALPVLKKKTGESPAVARLMGMYLWKDSLPQFVKWASSRNEKDREKAKQGLSAEADPRQLLETRGEMLRIVRDPKAAPELRHLLAVKSGIAATEEDVGQLLGEHEASKDEGLRLYLAAALYASRSPQTVPLLTHFVRTHPNPLTRAGTLTQLRDMLPPADYRLLLEWTAANDPNPDNRESAREQLKTSARRP